ncbi:hypothetical protein E2C00_13625 [Streptomyces sp. WAC05374]|uniref:hypothetical protein n=1 Tax=Streptomyces sp. WAC05374 TaxID=2487420 RepID=UPI000F886B0E|nr:hypothetical protein [Streptomyces sp. WAC05374]RST13123.1 hypothetical protein EF905_21090 [Streptomyces sp. WAC05374]TDF44778.1 hypothetical protein E2B92_15330 [Streptomyces sp. WAC05374]TDF56018.1 hypothetical protein E2C00_13625 [Streptomyces sp. WAC05374]TDF59809.1 hypothetical protein E2C02_03835 [Streptomyces sp. WAC05374]
MSAVAEVFFDLWPLFMAGILILAVVRFVLTGEPPRSRGSRWADGGGSSSSSSSSSWSSCGGGSGSSCGGGSSCS